MITIEFSFAWLFCIIMFAGFVGALYGLITSNAETFVLGIGLIFICDVACVLGSGFYMSHPINGWKTNPYLNKCAEYNYTTHSFENYQQCIMPTPQDNPYEKQPLHPIKWIIGFIWESVKLATGAVQFKVT